ncbi:MAG: hypothetical protein HQL40_05700 [Alphaproteobacteria bacterium]|nr:hypothetical protein [Alphaproteobacteria bacterium]
MRRNATLALRGDELPPALSAALDGSEAGAVYAVHVRKLSVEDAAEFLDMKAKVREGLAAIEAGDLYDEEAAFVEIERLIAARTAE